MHTVELFVDTTLLLIQASFGHLKLCPVLPCEILAYIICPFGSPNYYKQQALSKLETKISKLCKYHQLPMKKNGRSESRK